MSFHGVCLSFQELWSTNSHIRWTTSCFGQMHSHLKAEGVSEWGALLFSKVSALEGGPPPMCSALLQWLRTNVWIYVPVSAHVHVENPKIRDNWAGDALNLSSNPSEIVLWGQLRTGRRFGCRGEISHWETGNPGTLQLLCCQLNPKTRQLILPFSISYL